MVGIPIRCDIWQGVAVVGLMVGKAQQWALFVRHRVTLNHQQQAAILYLWSQTFPESGNLSPVRGRLGAPGATGDRLDTCLTSGCLASHWHGSLYPGPPVTGAQKRSGSQYMGQLRARLLFNSQQRGAIVGPGFAACDRSTMAI